MSILGLKLFRVSKMAPYVSTNKYVQTSAAGHYADNIFKYIFAKIHLVF